MKTYDAIIVGGGPAGSTCAWQLVRLGMDVVVIDRARFPRVKLCAGWITPPVVDALELDLEDYRQEHTVQDFYGFNVSRLHGREQHVSYDSPISYGIVRSELDHFLLERSGADVVQDTPVESIVARDDCVMVNGRWRSPLLIGAGGHYCPVARHLGVQLRKEKVLSTLEVECELSDEAIGPYRVEPGYPEIVYFDDMRGYGWCFRKGRFVNLGVGRTQPKRLRSYLDEFLEVLRTKGKIPESHDFESSRFRGHAYKLHKMTPRPYYADRVLLVGDASGLTFNFSGEGIRPAVESARFAAEVIADANEDYCSERLAPYRDHLYEVYGAPITGWRFQLMEALPPQWFQLAGHVLLSSPKLAREVAIDRLFLRRASCSPWRIAPPARASRTTLRGESAYTE